MPVPSLTLSGATYRIVPELPESTLEVGRSMTGWHLRLTATCAVAGPCWRCLVDATHPARVDAREFQATGRVGASFDEDLDSQYVEGHTLDVAGWLLDAVADALPASLLCREECLGLCARCGADLNAGPCGCDPGPPPDAARPFSGLAERLARESGDA